MCSNINKSSWTLPPSAWEVFQYIQLVYLCTVYLYFFASFGTFCVVVIADFAWTEFCKFCFCSFGIVVLQAYWAHRPANCAIRSVFYILFQVWQSCACFTKLYFSAFHMSWYTTHYTGGLTDVKFYKKRNKIR